MLLVVTCGTQTGSPEIFWTYYYLQVEQNSLTQTMSQVYLTKSF